MDNLRNWHGYYEPPDNGLPLRSRNEIVHTEPYVEVMVNNNSNLGVQNSHISMDCWLNQRGKLLHDENPLAESPGTPDLLILQHPEEERMVQMEVAPASKPVVDCKRRKTPNGPTKINNSQPGQCSSTVDSSAAVVDYLHQILANQEVLESKIDKVNNRLSFIEEVQRHTAIRGKTLSEAQYQQMRAEYNLVEDEDSTSKILQS